MLAEFRKSGGSTGHCCRTIQQNWMKNTDGRSTSFATCALSPPLAAPRGTLVRVRADRGWADSVCTVAPVQIELPPPRYLVEAQKNNQFAPLGSRWLVKTAILAERALYRVDVKSAQSGITTDKIASIKAEYVAMGGLRSNTRYGYVAPARG